MKSLFAKTDKSIFVKLRYLRFNPILTGLFESKFLLGGGGGGGAIWPPLQISAPKGPIAAKFCMDVKTHLKSIATEKKNAENGLFIILL